MYLGDDSPEEQSESVFFTERHCLYDLLEGVSSSCPCGMTRKAWMLESVVQVCLCRVMMGYPDIPHIERSRSPGALQL